MAIRLKHSMPAGVVLEPRSRTGVILRERRGPLWSTERKRCHQLARLLCGAVLETANPCRAEVGVSLRLGGQPPTSHHITSLSIH